MTQRLGRNQLGVGLTRAFWFLFVVVAGMIYAHVGF